MEQIKQITGDVIERFQKGHYDIIAHGCNCYGVWGAGVAKGLKEAFPKAYEEEREYCLSKERLSLLGTAHFVQVDLGHRDDRPFQILYSLYTQYGYGPKGKKSKVVKWGHDPLLAQSYSHVHTEDFTEALKDMRSGIFEAVGRSEKVKIGMPYIGCGYGGLTNDEFFFCLKKVFNLLPNVEIELVSLSK